MIRKTYISACLALAISLISTGSLAHQPGPYWQVASDRAPRLQLAQAKGGISADRAAAIAAEVTGGRVLSVDRHEGKTHVVYRVKVLMSDGRVRVIHINGETGRVNG